MGGQDPWLVALVSAGQRPTDRYEVPSGAGLAGEGFGQCSLAGGGTCGRSGLHFQALEVPVPGCRRSSLKSIVLVYLLA